MTDFYTRIAPWTRTAVGGPVDILAGGVVAVQAAVAAGFNRWILGFQVSQDDNFLAAPILLRTVVNRVSICQLGYRFSAIGPVLNLLLTNSADTALEITNTTATVTPSKFTVWTLVFADTPANVLSNLVIGQLAG